MSVLLKNSLIELWKDTIRELGRPEGCLRPDGRANGVYPFLGGKWKHAMVSYGLPSSPKTSRDFVDAIQEGRQEAIPKLLALINSQRPAGCFLIAHKCNWLAETPVEALGFVSDPRNVGLFEQSPEGERKNFCVYVDATYAFFDCDSPLLVEQVKVNGGGS